MSELIIENGNKKIYGHLFMPHDLQTKHPLIILSHGYNGCHTNFADDADFFAQNGYVSYCFDFCGGSAHSKSSGKTSDMTIFTEKQDLEDIFAYFEKQNYIDTENIYLWGASQGGFVSALAAAELQKKVKALILLYPAFCIPNDWNNTFKNTEDIPEDMDFWGMTLGKNFFVTARAIDVFKSISGYTGPVYIFHGTDDKVVPLSYSEKAKNIYKNANLVVMDEEGHGFSQSAEQQVRNCALEFIRK